MMLPVLNKKKDRDGYYKPGHYAWGGYTIRKFHYPGPNEKWVVFWDTPSGTAENSRRFNSLAEIRVWIAEREWKS